LEIDECELSGGSRSVLDGLSLPLTCVAGDGGVRSSGRAPKRRWFHPGGVGEGKTGRVNVSEPLLMAREGEPSLACRKGSSDGAAPQHEHGHPSAGAATFLLVTFTPSLVVDRQTESGHMRSGGCNVRAAILRSPKESSALRVRSACPD